MSRRGGDFVKKYEVMFIAKPLEEAEVTPIVEFISNLLTKNGAKIEKVDLWGKRRLAYPVKKQNDGYYVLINFEIEPDAIFEIDRVIKIREEILRHLIVKIVLPKQVRQSQCLPWPAHVRTFLQEARNNAN